MALLYANNHEPIEISDEDMDKIGRREVLGYNFGTVTDQDTGTEYEVYQASCNLENCNCAVTIEEVE